jgi:hypothetical protein
LSIDSFGTAEIPLEQSVQIVTGHHVVTVEFFSDLDSYNRLLYPYAGDVFSDFEALGVKAHLVVVQDGITILGIFVM